jgi:hypothetical protein
MLATEPGNEFIAFHSVAGPAGAAGYLVKWYPAQIGDHCLYRWMALIGCVNFKYSVNQLNFRDAGFGGKIYVQEMICFQLSVKIGGDGDLLDWHFRPQIFLFFFVFLTEMGVPL